MCSFLCMVVISSFPTKVIFLKLCSMNVQPLVSDSVSLILRHTFKTFILIKFYTHTVAWCPWFCLFAEITFFVWKYTRGYNYFIYSCLYFRILDIPFSIFFSLNVIYVYKYTCLAYQKRLIKAIEDANNIGLLKLFDTEARQLVKRISWLKDISYAKEKEKRFLSCDV